MLYAKVVVGLPVEGPFDYIVPTGFRKKIKVGVRVHVTFRTKELVGYVVKLASKTKIKNLKAILEVIDDSPILDKDTLLLTKKLCDYYCCSWGEAIETALPEGLRRGKLLPKIDNPQVNPPKSALNNQEIILLHDLDGLKRWEIYLQEIKQALGNNRSVIILLPDIDSVLTAKEMLSVKLDCSIDVLYRKQPQELNAWLRIKEGRANIVIGSRSGIFAPLNNLGLIIIDEEQASSYKQDQVPHYHPREVGFMRMHIEKAKLILGSTCPSLESFYLAKESKTQYIFIPRTRDFPEIKIIDTKDLIPIAFRRNIILSKYLQDSIVSALATKGKILLFLNRRGFATLATCRHCDTVLKCPRCNINLVYHFKENTLNCHYCNFKMSPPQICPNCNSGSIRYSGIGTEKIESELSRLFPEARIKSLDKPRPFYNTEELQIKKERGKHKDIKIEDADIFIATKSIIKKTDLNFDLIGVLYIDNYLNRIDFRAGEKTFDLLLGLLRLTDKKLVIQTNLPGHHCFAALLNKGINMFYEEELRQRKQLNFPPYKHFALLKLRGRMEARIKEASNVLFKALNKYHKIKSIKIVSVNPGQPSKLRGNFYWQILIRGDSSYEISRFLKMHLKDFSHSGIIVTVDIDPV